MTFLSAPIVALLLLSAPPAADPAEFAPITREELSHAYLRFDKLLHDNPPTPERLIELNKAFDAVSLQFFSFQLAAATSALNDLSISLLPADMDQSDKDNYRVAWSLAVELSPADLRTDSPDAAITLRGMYPVKITSPATIWTELAPSDAPLIEKKPTLHTIQIPASGPITLRLPLQDIFTPRRENLAITLSYSAADLLETRHYLVPRSDPTIFARPYAGRLESTREVKGIDAGYQRARAIATERYKLLSGTHSSSRSAEFLLDPRTHQRILNHEFKLLTSGLNPYRNLAGEIYRPIIPADPKQSPIPCRVYVPADLSEKGSGAPLVIAFHGAGGDESMFLDAYGNGEIKRLADQFHFIVACPFTNAVLSNRAAVTALIDQLAEDQHIDRSRIYVIGHSLGAGLASALAREEAEKVAAVVCFSGGDIAPTPGTRIAPTLIFGAQLDPIAAAGPLAKRAAAAKAAGLPVEFRLGENQGHTLIVNARLREAVDWLLPKALSPK